MAIKITAVIEGSEAARLGLKADDRIVLMNGSPVNDHVDVMYYGSDEELVLTVHRGTYEFKVRFDGVDDYGFEIEPMKFRRCGNNCVFCFIDQNPPGMREDIYFKDEDYRLSFLHGSYVTLTNLKESDLARIVQQHLSPLYVSVHATDMPTRIKLLGIKKDDCLVKNMDRLLTAGIKMHCQIVVCPGINDGEILRRSIHDLRRRYPGVQSIAVVPVGLTKYRDGLPKLTPVDGVVARAVVKLVDGLHDAYTSETGDGFVYCSDEWYIKAGLEVPELPYYDDFPQIENGVGMVRDFLEAMDDMEGRLGDGVTRSGAFVFVTGVSMAKYARAFTERLSGIPDIVARAAVVENDFFGPSVTVSGLLTGGDILRALKGNVRDETVVLPPNCLNRDGRFLDDTTPDELSDELGIEVLQGDYDPLALFLA